MYESLSVETPSVYTGVWTNWTKGKFLGSTLTLTNRDGALLIAFLALFIRLIGGHLWKIISFVLFVLRSSSKPRDGLHHQQQALLRSNLGDLNSAWQYLHLAWHWKSILGRARVLQKSIPFSFLAVVHAGLFIVGGIFSSRIAGARGDVLLNNVSCGQFPIPLFGSLAESPDSMLTFSAISARIQRNHGLASNYAAACYRSSTVNISWSDCQVLGRSRIDWSKTDVECPFAQDMCTAQAVQFDSGIIDSHLHLGINAPENDRVTYRRRVQCSPITTAGYRQNLLTAEALNISARVRQQYDTNETFSGFFYGPNSELLSPATFYVPTRKYPRNAVGDANDILPYDLSVVAFADRGYFPNQVIPALRVENATTAIIFLHNNAAYFDRVDDPWFTANVSSTKEMVFPDGTISENVTVYSNPEVVSVLGCTEQWQWCNPVTGLCSPFTAQLVRSAQADIDTLGINARQKQTLSRIETASGPSSLVPLITLLGAPSLLATKSAALGSLPLPSGRWIREIDHWFGTSMATMQLDILQYVTGDGDPLAHLYQIKPSAEEQWMCTNQIVQRTDHTSFSIVALSTVVAIGGLIIFISIFLHECLPSTKKFGASDAGVQWSFHGVLELQSIVFKMKGLGHRWMHKLGRFPIAGTADEFHIPRNKPEGEGEGEHAQIWNQHPLHFTYGEVDNNNESNGNTDSHSSFAFQQPPKSQSQRLFSGWNPNDSDISFVGGNRIMGNSTETMKSEAEIMLIDNGYNMS